MRLISILLLLTLTSFAETQIDTFGFVKGPDNKWVVAGVEAGGDQPYFFVAKVNPSGEFDSSFGKDGIQRYPSPNENYLGHHLVVYPDNKAILFSLLPKKDKTQFELRRILADSKMDGAFGKNGVAGFEGEATPEEMKTSGIDPLGRIFSVGCAPAKGGCKPSVTKLQSNGKKDLLQETESNQIYQAIETDSKENIYLAGQTAEGEKSHAFLTKLDSKGKPVKTSDLGPGSGRALFIDSKGRAYVAGETYQKTSTDLQIVRADAEGNVDKSFGKDGKLIYPTTLGKIYPKKIFAAKDSGWLLAGNYETEKELGLFFLKFDESGKMDAKFGKDGFKALTYAQKTKYTRKLGMHWKSFQVSGLDIYQPASGQQTLIPMVTWNPYWQYSKNLSFYLNVGFFVARGSSSYFIGLEYSMLAGYHFHPNWVVKLGAGAQTWISYNGTEPLIQAQVAWLVPKKMFLDRVFVGYGYLVDPTTTHLISLGAGIEF